MLLNSNQVFEFLKNANPKALQQVSVDLHIKEVKAIFGGYIYKETKGISPYISVDLISYGGRKVWELPQGCYSVTFEEDCMIPSDKTGMILHKSSLVRIGGSLDCGIYDPGYKSKGGMGAVLTISGFSKVEIEKGSKIGTFYMFENTPVSKEFLYNGSYQGEKDIK